MNVESGCGVLIGLDKDFSKSVSKFACAPITVPFPFCARTEIASGPRATVLYSTLASAVWAGAKGRGVGARARAALTYPLRLWDSRLPNPPPHKRVRELGNL